MKSVVLIGIIAVVVVVILIIIGIILITSRGNRKSDFNPSYTQKMRNEIRSVSEGLNSTAVGIVTNGELDLYYNDDPMNGFYSLYDNIENTMYIGPFTGNATEQGFGVYLGKPSERIVGESVSTTDLGNIADLSLVSDGSNRFNATVEGLYEVIGMTYNETFNFRVRRQ